MPLTRKQFELGIDKRIEEWMRRIHSYLAQNKDQAFTFEEIAKAVGAWEEKDIGRKINNFPDDFVNALNKLVELGVVDSDLIRDSNYYALGRRPLELFIDP